MADLELIDALRRRIRETEDKLTQLKHELGQVTSEASDSSKTKNYKWPLTSEEYKRYGRQLIVKEVGINGQQRLKKSRVLVVGLGGLGCPAAAYLVGAGVGTLGLVDGDTVDISNLHRQILHDTSRVNMSKVESAIIGLREKNPLVKLVGHTSFLTSDTAMNVMKDYDLVLDCTDHPAIRYLISDTCVLLGKPIVSASALRTDGQLIVLNYPPKPVGNTEGGPCYRCIWPKPPKPEQVTSCAEGGVLGPVVGVMGVLQALEAIKIIVRHDDSYDNALHNPNLTIFSAWSSKQFHNIKMRGRRADCAVCSINASVKSTTDTDYDAFCMGDKATRLLGSDERINAIQLNSMSSNGEHVIVDVRPAVEFDICHLPNSVNLPWDDFKATMGAVEKAPESLPNWLQNKDIVIVCRKGNDSQLATRIIKETNLAQRSVVDLEDGLQAWSKNIDPTWPQY